MFYPSFSGSIDLATRLVAHVPIKFIVNVLAAVSHRRINQLIKLGAAFVRRRLIDRLVRQG
jgi:hypothetical protein